ncbi:MAG TPA: V-type ATP synthase subunit I [Clostridiaceae bacterium]|nr:V-type ATP synthase subunit I [Clostridiaceae bacterium]
MNKITVVGLASERDEVLNTLMRSGVMEIVSREDNADQISSEERLTIEHDLARLETANMQIYKRFPPESSSLFKSKVEVSDEEFLLSREVESETLTRLTSWEDLLSVENLTKQKQITLQEELLQISPWQDLDIDLSATETRQTEIIYGVFLDGTAIESLEEQLSQDCPETHIIRFRQTKEGTLAAVVMLKEQASHTRLLVQASDFHAVPAQISAGKPNQIISTLQGEIAGVKEQLSDTELELARLAESRSSFLLLEDNYRVLLDRDNASSEVFGSPHTFWLRGWVPDDSTDELIDELNEKHDVAISSVAGELSENFPIKLKNNKFNQAYEIILTMFGAPNAEESDPTPVLATFYMLLFGMMLSDVGYGLALIVLCLVMLFKFKVGGDMRRLAKMLLISGISSVAWGFVFGGFFGDLITVLSEGRYSFPVLWFDPMQDAMKLMIFSMLFGVIHLFAGMAIRIRNAKLQGNIMEGILDIVPWYMIIGGLLIIAGGAAGVFGAGSEIITQVGIYLALAGAVVVVLFGGRDAKNPIVRILKGILALYDVTGYFSDILSYTRILALVLATSVIAMVVNQLGFLLGPTFAGYILFIAVGLLGHTLNLALSALSAYVHASRLQYVEMFGKFFEGGGKYFKPLQRKTRHFQIEDRKGREEERKVA